MATARISIDELQADVADHSVSVTALLQKAIAVANRLGDDQFIAWARQELKGYSQEDKEVDYRRLKGRYVILTPDNRRVPIEWSSSVSKMDRRFITLPVSEMELPFPSDTSSSVITIQADSQLRTSFQLQPGDQLGFEIIHSTVAGFFQEIRNRVLDWSLTPQPQNPQLSVERGSTMQSGHWISDDTIRSLVARLEDTETVHGWDLNEIILLVTYHHEVTVLDVEMVLRAAGKNLGDVASSLKRVSQTGAITTRAVANGDGHRACTLWTMDVSQKMAYERSHKSLLTRNEKRNTGVTIDTRKIFVVHGRNKMARDSLYAFLRAIGLHPLEWLEVVQATGEASPYIGEVLQAGFRIVQAVVVLMTPDDEARLREPYRSEDEPAEETQLTPQPRPNVLFEAGMALGLFPDRTIIVEMGRLRRVSDIGGRYVVRMDNSTGKRQELAQRFQTAGCAVNLTGTDWHTAGSFDLAVAGCQPSSATERNERDGK